MYVIGFYRTNTRSSPSAETGYFSEEGATICGLCDYGYFMIKGRCRQCDGKYEGAECSDKRGLALDTLPLQEGFWRTSVTSTNILAFAHDFMLLRKSTIAESSFIFPSRTCR